MDRLDEALAREQRELDTVLLRLTTLRVLLASGKHRLVDRALEDLQDAMAGFEAAEAQSVAVLHSDGHETVSDAAEGLDDDHRDAVARRTAELRALHREVRIALASTATATERALRASAAVLEIDLAQHSGHRRSTPFFTEVD